MNRKSTLCALAATAFLSVSAAESQAGFRHLRSRGHSSHGSCQTQYQPVQHACCGTSISHSAHVTTMPSQGCCGSSVQGYAGDYNNGPVSGDYQMMDGNGVSQWNQGISNGNYGSNGQLYNAPGYSSQQGGNYDYSTNPNGSMNSNGQGSINSQGFNAGVNNNNGNAQLQGRTNANVNTENGGVQAGSNLRTNSNAAGANANGNSGIRANVNRDGASLNSGGNLDAGNAAGSAAGTLGTDAAAKVDAATDL